MDRLAPGVQLPTNTIHQLAANVQIETGVNFPNTGGAGDIDLRQVVTDDIEAAAQYFDQNDCIRRDEIEPLPEGLKAFWLASPANIIHLVNEQEG